MPAEINEKFQIVYKNLEGKLHRLDGPACILPTGTIEWWKNGKLHREDGPAIEYVSGSCHWFLNGQHYTKTAYDAKLKVRPLLSFWKRVCSFVRSLKKGV